MSHAQESTNQTTQLHTTMTNASILDYKAGSFVGNVTIAPETMARYEEQLSSNATGAVKASDWLTEEQTGSLGIAADLTIYIEPK